MPTLLPEVAGPWLASAPLAGPESGEVHLWWVDLGVDLDAEVHLRPTLDPDELAVADGLRRPHDRMRFVVAHAALRTILAGYLGRPPAKLEFRHGPGGKPELRDSPVRFSLSRSHDLALCAVGRMEVGVDVERVHGEEPEWLNLLCPKAWLALAALPEKDRPAAFYRAWTRMEACVKAAGTSVDLGVARLETFLDRAGARPWSYQLPQGSHWRCHDLTASGEYVGALALAQETTVRSTWWTGPGSERLVPGMAREHDSGHPAADGGDGQ
jgi:4'-phosphopantetheinyl transferase